MSLLASVLCYTDYVPRPITEPVSDHRVTPKGGSSRAGKVELSSINVPFCLSPWRIGRRGLGGEMARCGVEHSVHFGVGSCMISMSEPS